MHISDSLFLVLFAILFSMVIVWFVLIKLLFNRLEKHHPQKYEAMGRPSLFLRNSIAGGWATLKFLVARQHKALKDPSLSKLSDAMLVFITIYLLVFIGMLLALPVQVASNAA